MKHLLLIDASGFAYRAHYASPPRMRRDGMPVHAIITFMSMLHHMLKRATADQPDYAAAVFDAGGKTFRHKLFPAYKAQRVRDEALTRQFPLMRDVAAALGLRPVEYQGVEADDLIAHLARVASKADIRTTIVSVDKDLCQLAKEDLVEIVDPTKRERLTVADVEKAFGVKPEQIPDLLAIAGDAADNIPGVKGIGEKMAAGLVRRFGGVPGLIRAIDSGEGGGILGTPSRRKELRKSREDLRLFLKLTRLDKPIKLPSDFPAPTDLTVGTPNENHLREILRALEAGDQYDRIFGNGHCPDIAVAMPADPLEWWREELDTPGQEVPTVPQCGFYQRRLVHKGVMVPARIYHEPERDFVTQQPTGKVIVRCELNGKPANPSDHWGYLCLSPITEKQYRFMIADKDWAKKYAPDDPVANPYKKPNLHHLPAVAYVKPKKGPRK